MAFTMKVIFGLGSAGAVVGGLLGAVGGPPGMAVGASLGAMIGGALGGAAAKASSSSGTAGVDATKEPAADSGSTSTADDISTTSSHEMDLSAIPKTGPALGLREGHARRDVAMARKHRPSPQRRSHLFNASEAAVKVDSHTVESQQPVNAEQVTPMKSTAEAGAGSATTLSPESASAEGSTPEVSKRKHITGAVPGFNLLPGGTPEQVKLRRDHLKKTPVSDRKSAPSTPEVPEWVAIAQSKQKRASYTGCEHGAEGRAVGTHDEPQARKSSNVEDFPPHCGLLLENDALYVSELGHTYEEKFHYMAVHALLHHDKTTSTTGIKLLVCFSNKISVACDELASVHHCYKNGEISQSPGLVFQTGLIDVVEAVKAEMKKLFDPHWKTRLQIQNSYEKANAYAVTNCGFFAARIFQVIASDGSREDIAIRWIKETFSQLGLEATVDQYVD